MAGFKPGNSRASIVAWRRAGWVAPRRWGSAEPAARRPPLRPHTHAAAFRGLDYWVVE